MTRVAQLSKCTREQVVQFINKLKECILGECLINKRNIELNLHVGFLRFSAGGIVDFS